MKNQLDNKTIGIWMDHHEAKLMLPNDSHLSKEEILSDHDSRIRIDGESGDGMKLGSNRSTNNEYSKHQIEQHDIHAFFKKIADRVEAFDRIYIFGPTTAASEFQHFLEGEKRFSNTLISTSKEDYLTDVEIREKVNSKVW